MKHIIHIEDRPERMNLFIQSIEGYELSNYPFFTVKTKDEFDEVKHALSSEGYKEYLKPFDVIICHRSAFQEDKRMLLKDYCKNLKKALVFFSGGITESIYQNNGYPFLSINSKNLYTINLFLFLEEVKKGTLEPLILQYGEMWELNVLLTLRDRLNQLNIFVNKNNDSFYEMFDAANSLLKTYYSNELSILGEDFSDQELEKVQTIIETKIKSKIAFDL